MNVISLMLNFPNSIGEFSNIKHELRGLNHLLYTDDLLIFGEASHDNLQAFMNIFDHFSSLSGLKFNYNKSKIIYSNDVMNPGELARQVDSALLIFLLSTWVFPFPALSLEWLISRSSLADYMIYLVQQGYSQGFQ